MKLFGVYGASGFGREVMPVLRQQVESEADAKCVFVDDAGEKENVNGHECMTFEKFASYPADERAITLAIGDGKIRRALAHKCKSAGVEPFNVIAQNSVIMDEVYFAEGLVLCPFSTITSNAKIGRHFHANIYSYVAHDCIIGDFVTFAPGVKCNGNIHVEDGAYVGTGAILRQGQPGRPLLIGRDAVVGMGAVVTKNVPPGTTVVGNPAHKFQKI